ncbi:MAG: hypothetical protein JRI89_15020, partial [Deltaproteobacteria bacterium]|nr:hypothetical protein [Deltaproteobacteria bacterium]
YETDSEVAGRAIAGTNANGAGVNVEAGFVKWDIQNAGGEVPEGL